MSSAHHNTTPERTTSTRRRPLTQRRHRSKAGAAVWVISLALALIVSLIVLVLFAAPTWGQHDTLISTAAAVIVWPTLGPWVIIVALVAVAVGIIGIVRRAPRRTAWVTSAVAVLALVASVTANAQIISATTRAGGSINVLQALTLSPMNEAPADATETYTNADGDQLRIDVYKPPASSTPAPVMMYIHGGGFAIGSPRETAADLRWFADQGWLVMSPEYRLATPEDATWQKAPQDVACALGWTAENADRFGGDPSSLALLGDSAGGNLATNLAYASAEGIAPFGCGTVPTPDALVVQYPEVDIKATEDAYLLSPDEDPARYVEWYIGGTQQQFSDRVRAISSATYLTPKAPPTLLIEPQADAIIKTDAVMAWAGKAEDAGVDLTVAKMPLASHVYNQQAYNSIGNQARRTITENYLEEQGFAPPAN